MPRRSAMDRIPVDRAFRALLPLYPAAFRSLGTLSEDLLISSSSGWAHGVRTAPESTHVVYCHTPARWLYKGPEYTPSRTARIALAPVTAALRSWDRRAAKRANLYLANSENTRQRIRKTAIGRQRVCEDVARGPRLAVRTGRQRVRPAGAERGQPYAPMTVRVCARRRSRAAECHRHSRAGEAANCREQGVKREVVELNGEQHDACSDPCDGQASTFFLTPNCTT